MASLIKFALVENYENVRDLVHDTQDDKILATDNHVKANMRYQAWW